MTKFKSLYFRSVATMVFLAIFDSFAAINLIYTYIAQDACESKIS
jgi:hypothetical protein